MCLDWQCYRRDSPSVTGRELACLLQPSSGCARESEVLICADAVPACRHSGQGVPGDYFPYCRHLYLLLVALVFQLLLVVALRFDPFSTICQSQYASQRLLVILHTAGVWPVEGLDAPAHSSGLVLVTMCVLTTRGFFLFLLRFTCHYTRSFLSLSRTHATHCCAVLATFLGRWEAGWCRCLLLGTGKGKGDVLLLPAGVCLSAVGVVQVGCVYGRTQ